MADNEQTPPGFLKSIYAHAGEGEPDPYDEMDDEELAEDRKERLEAAMTNPYLRRLFEEASRRMTLFHLQTCEKSGITPVYTHDGFNGEEIDEEDEEDEE